MVVDSGFGFTHPFSALTHLTGALYFAVQGYFVLRRESGIRFISFAVFAGACVFLLLASGVYHLLPSVGLAHTVFQRLDHAGIFLVIAGTFTPIHCTLFGRFLRWGVLSIVWVLGLCGIILKSIYFNTIPEWLGLSFFLGLGWMGLITGVELWQKYSFDFIRPLLLGGAFYTVGAIIEYQNKLVIIPGIIGPHEILHVAVLFGIGFHWQFVVKALASAPRLTKSR